jgi:GTP-binding protein EngB required for normal cell division
MPENAGNSLNANHVRRLSVTCRYLDKLLADMEAALNISTSKLAFPQYVRDVAPAQQRVIEDYIVRIRAQLMRVLDGQGIERPAADIPVSRALHSLLTFIDIAVEELKPEYMRGYGEIPPSAAVELNGIAGELRGLVNQLDRYVRHGARENLQTRLERLEELGDEVTLLKKLETAITAHGLVEYRSTLSMILDRLEDNGFEIAIFGRVSSGKSSLLNTILETDTLPVGVTPITAVPTRITFGKEPTVDVWFANRTPERFDLSRLSEFVAEQSNPGNEKHITKVVVYLPSPRLRDGVIFVDTPGLGSLATRGAAETMAYLPRCDLGVVLIDAASTLTPEDLQTIRVLYEAAVPVMVLLSKADILSLPDRARIVEYVRKHINDELQIDLSVHPVSVMPQNRNLLDEWFVNDIMPLYGQRQDLKLRSVKRKIGALRRSVEFSLQSRLRRKDKVSTLKVESFRNVEKELRQGNGKLEDLKEAARNVSDLVERLGPRAINSAAPALVSVWKTDESEAQVVDIIRREITNIVEERTRALQRVMVAATQESQRILESAARVLEMSDIPSQEEFASLVREMPVFDIGELDIRLGRPTTILLLGNKVAEYLVAKRLAKLIGTPLSRSLSTYRALLNEWAVQTLAQIQRRFDGYANSYRAYAERTLREEELDPENRKSMQRDLQEIGSAKLEDTVAS